MRDGGYGPDAALSIFPRITCSWVPIWSIWQTTGSAGSSTLSSLLRSSRSVTSFRYATSSFVLSAAGTYAKPPLISISSVVDFGGGGGGVLLPISIQATVPMVAIPPATANAILLTGMTTPLSAWFQAAYLAEVPTATNAPQLWGSAHDASPLRSMASCAACNAWIGSRDVASARWKLSVNCSVALSSTSH